MPSCASTMSTSFRRFRANTRSWRIVGLSSTIRIRWRAMSLLPSSLRQEVDESLDRVQLGLRLGVESGGEHGGRGVTGEQREELVVERSEAVLLLQQLVDRDRADRAVLHAQRHAHDRPREVLERASVAALGLAARDRRPDQSLAELAGGEVRHRPSLGRDRRQHAGALVEDVDREDLGSDQVDHDLDDDLHDLGEIQRGVQLERRDVEAREVVVLLLDLEVAGGEVAILAFDHAQPLEHVLALAFEAVDPREQILAELLPFDAGRRRQLLTLECEPLPAQALVLLEQLLGELGAAPEQRQHLLGAPEQFALLAHTTDLAALMLRSMRYAPPRRAGAQPSSSTPAISDNGSTASTTPVRIACCGMPNTTAVCSDSATTR